MTTTDRVDPETEDDAPVEELRDLESVEVGSGMVLRVRRAIERRLLIGDVANFSWFAPVQVLKEFLHAGFQLFAGDVRTGSKEDTDGWKSH